MNLGVDREWQIVRAIQNFQLVWNEFDVAGREFRIFRSGDARRNFPRDLNDVFAPQTVRLLCQLGVFFRSKHNLRKTLSVAQVDKYDAAMIARNVDPTGKRGILADVAFAE